MKNIFWLALCFITITGRSQITFERLYTNPLKQIGVQGIQFSPGYLISTKIDNCGLCNGYIQFIRIDDYGDTMRTFNIPNYGNEQGPVKTLFLSDNHLVIAADNTNGLNNQITIINSDTLGNVFWHYTITDSLYDYHASSMIQTDSAYFITGMKAYPGFPELTRTFLLSVSKIGYLNWVRSYGDPYENFATGLRMQNNDIYITGSMYDTVEQKVQPYILNVDTAGNVNQFKEIEVEFETSPTGIAGDDLSNYIYGYTVDSLLNTNSILIRLNLNLDTIWTSILDQGNFETSRCGISNDIGGITLTASVNSFLNSDGDILLCKYDSSGNILFVNTISGFDNEPFSSSLIQIQDQGYFIVTTTYNNLNFPSVCAFKTDSLGEIITAIGSPTKSPLEIYPNPSNGIFRVVNDSQLLSLEIFNLQGKILKQFGESKIDITEFENGIYIFKANLESNKVVYGKLIKVN